MKANPNNLASLKMQEIPSETSCKSYMSMKPADLLASIAKQEQAEGLARDCYLLVAVDTMGKLKLEMELCLRGLDPVGKVSDLKARLIDANYPDMPAGAPIQRHLASIAAIKNLSKLELFTQILVRRIQINKEQTSVGAMQQLLFAHLNLVEEEEDAPVAKGKSNGKSKSKDKSSGKGKSKSSGKGKSKSSSKGKRKKRDEHDDDDDEEEDEYERDDDDDDDDFDLADGGGECAVAVMEAVGKRQKKMMPLDAWVMCCACSNWRRTTTAMEQAVAERGKKGVWYCAENIHDNPSHATCQATLEEGAEDEDGY